MICFAESRKFLERAPMKQTTVRLDETDFHTAVHLARAKSVTLGEYIRKAVVEKNTAEAVVAEVEGARQDIKDMLDVFRAEVGRLHHDLIQSQRLTNEALAKDLETKFAEEVDDQRDMLVEMFKKFAAYREGNDLFGLPPMKAPSSRHS